MSDEKKPSEASTPKAPKKPDTTRGPVNQAKKTTRLEAGASDKNTLKGS